MMIEYQLSSRQRAALKRGDTLRLAIPINWGMDVNNCDGVIRELIPEIEHRLPLAVIERNVWVNQFHRANTGTLEGFVGSIVDRKNLTRVNASYSVRVLVAYVSDPNAARTGKAHPIRWPGGKVINIVPADYEGV